MTTEIESTEYEGLFTVLYDLLHPGTPEAGAYGALAREQGGSLLELGSGTGRLVIPLARAGIEDVWGLDRYDDMLAACRAKLPREAPEVVARVTLVEGDARDFSLGRTFPLITAPCNFLDNLLGADDLARSFRCVARHLAEDGVFVIDSSAPDLPTMVSSHGIEQVGEFTHPETGHRLVSRFTPRFDFVRQIETDEIEIEELDGETVVRRARTTMTVTWHHPRELKGALVAAGLEVTGVYGSVDRAPLRESGGDVVLIARPSRP